MGERVVRFFHDPDIHAVSAESWGGSSRRSGLVLRTFCRASSMALPRLAFLLDL